MSSCTGKNKTQKQGCTEERIQGMRAKCHEDCLLSLCFQCDVSSQAVRKQLWKKRKTINSWSESKEVQCLCLSFLSFQVPLLPRNVLATGPLKEEKERFISDHSFRWQPSMTEKWGQEESENSWSYHIQNQNRAKQRHACLPANSSHSPLLQSSESSA